MSNKKKKTVNTAAREAKREVAKMRTQRNKDRKKASHRTRLEKKLRYLKKRLEQVQNLDQYRSVKNIAPKLGAELHQKKLASLSGK